MKKNDGIHKKGTETGKILLSRPTVILCLLILALMLSVAGCAPAEAGPEMVTAEEPAPEPVKAAESGAEYFRQHFSQKAEDDPELDFSHMSLEQLETMVSSTSGAVVDTEELTIEVAGALFSGNTAEIVLRVTAKELGSVWNDDARNYFSNYCFEDESGDMLICTLDERWCYVGCQQAYSEPSSPPAPDQISTYVIDTSLAPNQYLLRYSIVTPDPLEMDSFTISLRNFGRFGRKTEGRMVPLYEDKWQVDIAVDPADDSSKRLAVNEEIQVGEYRFLVEDIQITPLACAVHLTCQGDNAYIDEHAEEIQQTIWDGRNGFTLHFSDGTGLTPDPFRVDANLCEDKYQLDGGSYYDEYHVLFWFDAPMAVEDIVSLSLLGNEFSIDRPLR